MTAQTAAQIAAIIVKRAASTSAADRNNYTRQADRLALRAVVVPATKPTPVAAPKPAAKPVAKGLNAPATTGQIRRINRAEIALGYRVSPATVLGTIGDAKKIWRGLSDDAAIAGIRLDRR